MRPVSPATSDRPRDLVLAGRFESVSDDGLLGLLVGESAGPLLAEHPLPDAFWRLNGDDLLGIAGLGPAGAARVLACLEIGRRASRWSAGERPTITTPEDVVEVCAARLRGCDREHFWAIALNTKNRMLRLFEVSIGSLNASIVHPRELFRDAVRASAASIVVVHNHPSGDPTPSGADIQLTRRLVKAGDVLGIEVLDHVVIGDGGDWTSLRDAGLM